MRRSLNLDINSVWGLQMWLFHDFKDFVVSISCLILPKTICFNETGGYIPLLSKTKKFMIHLSQTKVQTILSSPM